MKINLLFILLLSGISAFAQVAPLREISFVEEYITSKNKWEKAKAVHQDSYRFTLEQISEDEGLTKRTTVTVQNGKITERAFEQFNSSMNDKERLKYSWTEDQAHINTHGDGVIGFTFDQIYENCIVMHLSQDTKEYKIIFEIDKYGLIATCGSTQSDCEKDCFLGYEVVKFEWLE